MGTVYRKTYTKPLPPDAETFTRKGERFARWKDSKGKSRTAPLTVGKDGTDRIVAKAGTFTEVLVLGVSSWGQAVNNE